MTRSTRPRSPAPRGARLRVALGGRALAHPGPPQDAVARRRRAAEDVLRRDGSLRRALVAAAATTKLQGGTGICLVIQRDPIQTAKQVATLDQVRRALPVRRRRRLERGGDGEPRHPVAARWKLLRERIEAMKEIWTQKQAEYHGKLVDFDPMFAWPKPVQKPHPPIHVGGAFPAACAARSATATAGCRSWAEATATSRAGARAPRRGRRRPRSRRLEVSAYGVPPAARSCARCATPASRAPSSSCRRRRRTTCCAARPPGGDDAEGRMNETVDVAIVGYGPVGQLLAILLGQRGWRVQGARALARAVSAAARGALRPRDRPHPPARGRRGCARRQDRAGARLRMAQREGRHPDPLRARHRAQPLGLARVEHVLPARARAHPRRAGARSAHRLGRARLRGDRAVCRA